jgi:hypothetical protein
VERAGRGNECYRSQIQVRQGEGGENDAKATIAKEKTKFQLNSSKAYGYITKLYIIGFEYDRGMA